MTMSRTVMSECLIRFQAREEQLVMRAADDSNRELMLEIYEKTKITPEILLRPYSAEDVRELCLRTKVRVKMYAVNAVWDAKVRFDKKGRLDNRSERYINSMLLKAVRRKMVEPYTDEEVQEYSHIARCNAKQDNNARLDRWRLQRETAAPPAADQQDSSPERPESEDESQQSELQAESQRPESPPDLLELPSMQAESQPESQRPESPPAPLELPSVRVESQEQAPETQMPNMQYSEQDEPFPSSEPFLPPSAQEAEPNADRQESQTDLWGIGDEDDLERTNNEVQGTPSLDWVAAGMEVNTESISLEAMSQNSRITQNLESDYDDFGTQVVAASTQEQESQPFI
ncbi:hypothetical protein KR009_009518 [Drosophila setifemur]|nr:hypothetical protein KR009_009518 [Drosophila setifemur]